MKKIWIILSFIIGIVMLVSAVNGTIEITNYNVGVNEVGGSKSVEKSNIGNIAKGTIGGAISGFVIGGPIGAAIGGTTGILVTSLTSVFEESAISSRNANNEMQKKEYYQGRLQGLK